MRSRIMPPVALLGVAVLVGGCFGGRRESRPAPVLRRPPPTARAVVPPPAPRATEPDPWDVTGFNDAAGRAALAPTSQNNPNSAPPSVGRLVSDPTLPPPRPAPSTTPGYLEDALGLDGRLAPPTLPPASVQDRRWTVPAKVPAPPRGGATTPEPGEVGGGELEDVVVGNPSPRLTSPPANDRLPPPGVGGPPLPGEVDWDTAALDEIPPLPTFTPRPTPLPRPTPPAATTAPTLGSKRYVVQPGDTLSSIGRSHGLTFRDILRANPRIVDANHVQVGDELWIPAP